MKPPSVCWRTSQTFNWDDHRFWAVSKSSNADDQKQQSGNEVDRQKPQKIEARGDHREGSLSGT